MANSIRPNLPLPIPARTNAPAGGASEAARAAQRAFFSQALNAAQAPEPIAPTAAVTPVVRQAAAPAVEKAIIPDQPPERPLRPGSLLDIKI